PDRRVQGHPRRGELVDLIVGLEGGRDHPEDREDHHREDGHPDEAPAHATHPLPPLPARCNRAPRGGRRAGYSDLRRHVTRAHRTSPIFTIRPTYPKLTAPH